MLKILADSNTQATHLLLRCRLSGRGAGCSGGGSGLFFPLRSLSAACRPLSAGLDSGLNQTAQLALLGQHAEQIEDEGNLTKEEQIRDRKNTKKKRSESSFKLKTPGNSHWFVVDLVVVCVW